MFELRAGNCVLTKDLIEVIVFYPFHGGAGHDTSQKDIPNKSGRFTFPAVFEHGHSMRNNTVFS